jgi:Zn-dependent protease with chaperone function
LRIPNDPSPLVFAFGTWRHQYIAISDKALEVWSDEQALYAVMLHEFGHLASGDVWKTGLSFEYLKWFGVSGAFLLLSSIFKTNFTVSVFDILVSIGLVVTALTISVAVRFLFRIRELVADEFAINFSTDKSLINAFSKANTFKSDSEYSAVEGIYNNWLTRIFGFHPGKERLMLLQGKGEDIFNRGVPNLLFAAGLLIGQFTSFHSDISLVYKLLIGGTLFFAPFFLSLSLTSSNIEKITDRAFLLLESTIKLIVGVALSFIIQVLPNTFFETNPIDGKGFLVQSPIGLYHYIALFWDTFLILMLILPLILFVVVWISDITTRLVFASLGISRPAIVPWLIQSPLFIFLHWEWQNWSTGNSFTIKYALFFTSFWVLWIIAFYVFFKKRSQGISFTTPHKDLL